MKHTLFALAFAISLFALTAQAQTIVTCTLVSGCPERYYWEDQPCTAGVCNRSAVPIATDFNSGLLRGINLANTMGTEIQICAADGQTLSGAGTIRVWLWNPWVPNYVSINKQLTLNVANAFLAGACTGSTNCQCVHWTDYNQGGKSFRKVMLQAVNVTTSGGSSLRVMISGLGIY